MAEGVPGTPVLMTWVGSGWLLAPPPAGRGGLGVPEERRATAACRPEAWFQLLCVGCSEASFWASDIGSPAPKVHLGCSIQSRGDVLSTL